MNNGLFVESYRKVCNAYNREAKPEQAQFFFDQLKGFSDEDIPGAVNAMVELGRLPNLKDWKQAFSDSSRRNRKESTTQPFGSCPKCSAATTQRKLDDDEWYECCLACLWHERLFGYEEWKIRNGYEGLNLNGIAEKLRMDRV